ncbi:MAG: SDR family oxidoreductase [Phycisphaeraceae bacterium]|nr:SDR family oxidoreductase [Phycisphaeraceae bacterium]
MQLQGKTALVTGASSGIGEAVARDLASAGMNLVLTGRREDALRQAAAACKGNTIIVPADMTDPATPAKLIQAAVDRFGSLDVVFNNAGVMIVGTIHDIDIEAACRMVRTNVEGVYRLALLALRQMLQQKSGHLINVSSTLGQKVRPSAGAYAGTKHAVEAFSEDLRMQVAGTGVKVSVLEPGLTETHLQDNFPVHPSKALGITQMTTPADMARAVRFILEQPDHASIVKLMLQPAQQAM